MPERVMAVLVVEDELALAHAIAAALRLCGYNATTAENGLEALACVERSVPDLVLLDLQMPEMDGWEFLREFRARPGCADLPVVVTSAYHMADAAHLDAQLILEKPFDLDELLDHIERLLTVRRGGDNPHAAADGRAYSEA